MKRPGLTFGFGLLLVAALAALPWFDSAALGAKPISIKARPSASWSDRLQGAFMTCGAG